MTSPQPREITFGHPPKQWVKSMLTLLILLGGLAGVMWLLGSLAMGVLLVLLLLAFEVPRWARNLTTNRALGGAYQLVFEPDALRLRRRWRGDHVIPHSELGEVELRIRPAKRHTVYRLRIGLASGSNRWLKVDWEHEELHQELNNSSLPYLGRRRRVKRGAMKRRSSAFKTRQFRSRRKQATPTKIDSLEEAADWLINNTVYRPDEPGNDVWSSPRDFEEERAGDCDDHALWAWAKLAPLGHRPEFVLGRMKSGDEMVGHAWVRFVDDGVLWNLEATAKSRSRMLQPWQAVSDQYILEAAITIDRRYYLYWNSPSESRHEPSPERVDAVLEKLGDAFTD